MAESLLERNRRRMAEINRSVAEGTANLTFKEQQRRMAEQEEQLREQEEEREEEQREDVQRARFGLSPRWIDNIEGGFSAIKKEKDGLALIVHHDSLSPASEHPDVWEVRDSSGKKLWSSGRTDMAEFAFQGSTPFDLSLDLRHNAEKEFDELLKKRKAKSFMAGGRPDVPARMGRPTGKAPHMSEPQFSAFMKKIERQADNKLKKVPAKVDTDDAGFRKGGRVKHLTNKHVKGRGAGWHEQRLDHSKAVVKGKMKKWRSHK